MDHLLRWDRLIPYGIPPFLTMLMAFFLVSLTIRGSLVRRENQWFTLFCLVQGIYNLDLTLRTVIASPEVSLRLMRLQYLSMVFIVPLMVQFVHAALGIHTRKWLSRLLYLVALSLMVMTQFPAFVSQVHEFNFGFFPESAWGLKLFVGLFLICALYSLILLYRRCRQELHPEQSLRLRWLCWGFGSNLLLNAGNLLPVLGWAVYPPSNFGFLPLGLMAYGILHHHLLDTTKTWFAGENVSRFMAVLIWSPVGLAFVFWKLAPPGAFYSDLWSRLIPYALPSIFSFVTCFGLASFCFLRGRRQIETLLFGLICMLWGGLNVDKTLGMLLQDSGLALKVTRIDHFFLVCQLGLYAHFLHYFARFPRKAVYLMYGLSFIMIPLTQTEYYLRDIRAFYWGYTAQAHWGFSLFGVITLIEIIWGCVWLARAVRASDSPHRRAQYYYFLIGGGFTAILNLGNLPSINGYEFYPIGQFTFIPILIMAYGVFRYDLIQINLYSKRRLWSIGVHVLVGVGYALLIPLCLWAFEYIEVPRLYERFWPYSIPPLLSFLCCLFLSLASLRVGQNQGESLLFSLVCMIYAFLSIDVWLNMLVPTAEMGLQINRWDHFIFVFLPGVALHLIFKVTKRQHHWALVYLAYGLGAIMAPLTQTPWYFQGSYSYSWGFFAKKGPLFDVMTFIWLVGALYVMGVLWQAYQHASNPWQKRRMRDLMFGFSGGAIFLPLGNVPALHGYDVYPSGNFIFIPLSIFAYAILRYNWREALRLLHGMLFWVGMVAILIGIGFISQPLLASEQSWVAYTTTFLMVVISFGMARSLWKTLLDLILGKPSAVLQQVFERLADELSRARYIKDIYLTLKIPMFQHLLTERYTLLVRDPATAQFTGWESWNPERLFFAGDFWTPSGDSTLQLPALHPLLPWLAQSTRHFSQRRLEERILNENLQLLPQDRLRQAELVQPIFFEKQLTCLLVLDPKLDGAFYSRDQRAFLQKIGLALGPYLEHARLLENLEHKVQERTRQVQETLQAQEKISQQLQDSLRLQEKISHDLLESNHDLRQAHLQLEQQHTTLLATNRRLEELDHTKEQLFSKLYTLYHTDVQMLQKLLQDRREVSAEEGQEIWRQALRHSVQIEESLRPLTSLYASERAIRNKRVLVAETDRKQQIIAKMALGGTGVELDLVSELSEGVEQLAQTAYDIVCVNEDLIELARVAHQKSAETQIVFMTSKETPAYLHLLRANRFLTNIVTRNVQDRTFTLKNILTTISKLINRDLFGLEKYLNWGVEVREAPIIRSDERLELVEGMEAYFAQVGVRRSLISQCGMVAEELLMNAIYDAPTDIHGKHLYNHLPRTVTVELKPEEQGVFRYACDGLLLAISVEDPFGAFSAKTILDYLESCYTGRAGSLQHNKGGAGRGLYQIIETSDLLVINVNPQIKTEVIALFNLDPNKQLSDKHTSFHYFCL